MISTYTPADAHAAVVRGAAWLDRECPDWAQKIDLAELDFSDSGLCVLGQTADCIVGPSADPNDIYANHGYWRVVNAKAPTDHEPWSEDLGFDVPEPAFAEFSGRWEREIDARYEMLKIAWAECIRERLTVGIPF